MIMSCNLQNARRDLSWWESGQLLGDALATGAWPVITRGWSNTGQCQRDPSRLNVGVFSFSSEVPLLRKVQSPNSRLLSDMSAFCPYDAIPHSTAFRHGPHSTAFILQQVRRPMT